MRSVSAALDRLSRDGSWFARAHEVRFLVVRTSMDVRKAALKQLQHLEFHADNYSPWVALEDPRAPEDDGWQARANRLVSDWERRREAFAKQGIEVLPVESSAGSVAPPGRFLGVFPRRPGLDARVSPFVDTARAVLGALRDPLRGLVVILAPMAVDDPEALADELEVLLGTPALAPLRLVLVVDEETEPPRRLLEELGGAALECDCRVDPDAFEADVEALLASGDDRPRAAGTAGPRGVVPPRRVDDPPELPVEQRDAALREAGIDPRYVDEAPKLRNLLIGAALAMKQGRGLDAIKLQREARDLCGQLEMHQVKVICQIGLASYLSGLNQPELAIRELNDAARSAHDHDLPLQESQAHLSLGLVHALAKQLEQAARSYVQAARAAEAADSPLIAIEAWRLAGQLAAQHDLLAQATSAFQNAIRIASGTEARIAKVSSAPEAARALAALCRKHRLTAQAVSLEAQAEAMERGEEGGGDPEQAAEAPAAEDLG